MVSSIKNAFFREFRKSETERHELNYLFWECTTRCNLKCLHCGSDCAQDSRYEDMPLPDFLSALDTIKKPAENFIVVITGGEPLLRKDLELCGMEIRKRGMRWSIVTNGFQYTEERHNALLNAGMGAVTISLDGLKDTHNWLRNAEKSFERTDIALSLIASSIRLNSDVVTCVNQRNFNELPEIKNYLIAKGIKSWRLFTIIPIGRAAANPELQLSDKQFGALMDFIRACRNEKNAQIDVKFSCEGYVGDYECKVRDSGYFCRAGINIGSVLIDGSISACPNIDRSFSQGNIYRHNLYEVWKDRFEPFRNREWTKTGKCADCAKYKDCGGNGLHNWHNEKREPLVCHYGKLQSADF